MQGSRVNSWLLKDHVIGQQKSLEKAYRLQGMGKYALTKAEKRRLKNRQKQVDAILSNR